MGTDISVVMVYHDTGDPHRRASFEYARRWYGDLDLHIDEGPGGRGTAINRAVKATTGDVIVQVDSDSLVPIWRLFEAAGLAATPGLVVPHTRCLYLTQDVTAEVLAGREPFATGTGDCDWYGPGVGNAVVFSRATWEAAHGYDERMVQGDDAAFAYACEAYTGNPTRRIPGDVVHLWHPRPVESVPGTREYLRAFVPVAQYRDAAELGPEHVRALVESR